MKHLIHFLQYAPSRSIGIIFFINGLFFGTWVTRIPEVKDKLQLSDSEVGLGLLGLPIGALIIMPIMGRVTDSIGTGKATLILTLAMCASLLLAPMAPSLIWLALALSVYGFTTGGMDIAMNAAAATIEKDTGRTIMSTCHGFWSIGGMSGAALGSFLYAKNFPFFYQVSILASISIIISLLLAHNVLPIKSEPSDEPLFALPGKNLIILALVAFFIFMGEGAIADWSALYMKNELMSGEFLAGLAYAGFAGMMAAGRFYGDAIIDKVGPKRIVRICASLAAVSLGLLLLIGDPIIAIIGFSIAGIGFSIIVPVVFSESAKVPGMVESANIASVSSVGYFGFLVSPPLLGFVSDAWGLTISLGIVAVMCALSAILIR